MLIKKEHLIPCITELSGEPFLAARKIRHTKKMFSILLTILMCLIHSLLFLPLLDIEVVIFQFSNVACFEECNLNIVLLPSECQKIYWVTGLVSIYATYT